MITAEQIAHFQTFGFLALKQAFSSNEMTEISRVFDNLLEKDRQGQPVLDEKQQSRYLPATIDLWDCRKTSHPDRACGGRPHLRNGLSFVGTRLPLALL